MEKMPVITMKNLRMSYGSGPEVLKGIDLDVYPGQIIGYIGPNGAGKSTTVKIMLGIIEDYSGEVTILGDNIKNQVEYKRRIGYVPENGEIYDNLTAFEYLSFLGEIYGLDTEKVEVKAAQLMELFGIKEQLHARISSFSKGMRQKVLIIASLIHDPDILFLDEPLSGLDANSVMIVKEILDHLASKGKTIFYSSHIMDVVEKISHRIILLNEGIIAADGSFEELSKKNLDGSLEEIFNQLTGFDNQESVAEQFVTVLKED
ncbi:ABC transporter ATP-binding protein [Vallitalea okinawensis]|uniref:ABC transporter ATP-binding protein n=1 Tax=Vallitalea okinawensis TaxID=2078660 RepID=UPI000CFBD395|nr:ABC transporter ATP-binding protein [Vallitalea okinawensis]